MNSYLELKNLSIDGYYFNILTLTWVNTETFKTNEGFKSIPRYMYNYKSFCEKENEINFFIFIHNLINENIKSKTQNELLDLLDEAYNTSNDKFKCNIKSSNYRYMTYFMISKQSITKTKKT